MEVTPHKADALITKTYVKKILKVRDEDSHKGDNGRVLVIGGSKDYYGAPVLVGLAALRSSVDLVYLAVPEVIYNSVTIIPDLIVRTYPGVYLNKAVYKTMEGIEIDSINIGNGIAKNQKAIETAINLIKNQSKPITIDADCLLPLTLKHLSSKTILTPHPGEFRRMFNTTLPKELNNKIKLVEKLANEYNCTILLKGNPDIISNGIKTQTNETGNAGMTVGGTGDTLAGIAGALASQKYNLFDAACLAAYVNGAAGDLAFKKYGYSLLASDLINEIPNILLQLQKK